MQQNLRQAVEYMSRDIRMAGYGIPGNVTIPGNDNVIGVGITSIRALYAKDSTSGPDQIYILYLFDMDANQQPTVLSTTMTGYGSVTVDNASVFLPSGGEMVLIANPFSKTAPVTADLFQTTLVGGNVLNFGGTYGTISHTLYDVPLLPDLPPVVAKARFVRYFIDNTTDPAHPTLMVDRMAGLPPQPVADDIEDMQLSYGLDVNNDGVVDNPNTNTWVTSPSTPQIPQIRQVRLQLIARSRLPEAGWSEKRPGSAEGFGNRTDVATPDGYRRRTYDIVIDVRNSGV
jgi:hypothetical protein